MSEDPKEFLRRIEEAAALLESLSQNRRLLADVPETLRHKLLVEAGRVSRPDRKSQRDLAKAFRAKDKRALKTADEEVLKKTGMRKERMTAVFQTPPALPPHVEAPQVGELQEARKCYVCKTHFTEVHHFYASMCGSCGDLNWAKRQQTGDLRGRVAIVTGARVKIGYQASIMLLRAGAHVIATTRFPRDAAARYAKEHDFDAWADRIEVVGVDLRHTPSVEAFTRYVNENHTRLDFILNNACQTVRRPAGFYTHLLENEHADVRALPEPEQKILRVSSIANAPAMSQLALLEEDRERGSHLFPAGELDADLQQVDLRGRNSWRLTLAEVSATELLEVHLVNAVAPFVINARLKPLMLRERTGDKHIVNVSAMEGQFYRTYKTDRHPHTNMAKAALNMMTRTSAPDYAQDGIHMNSVDTGWVTDEDPAIFAERKTTEHGFHPPLDIVDGAARICDPIFAGLASGVHVWGQFLKDYKPTDW